MSLRHFLVGAAILTAIAGADVVPAAANNPTAWIHDGLYSSKIVPGAPYVRFTVLDEGSTIVVGPIGGSGSKVEGQVACDPSPELSATNANEFSSTGLVAFYLGSEVIAPNGTFSFNSTTVGKPIPYTFTLKFSGHFNRGTLIPGKTIAAVVTLSAPQVCATSAPTATFDLVWK
jgi:hypothetical protein